MKVHLYENGVDPRYGLIARSQKASRAARARTWRVRQDGAILKPDGWKYVCDFATEKYPRDEMQVIHTAIREHGFIVVPMVPHVRRCYVFDVVYDVGDVRVYSIDRELTAYRKFRQDTALSVQSRHFGSMEPKFVGELDIEDERHAKRLGIDYLMLQRRGFAPAVVSVASANERLRRALERELPDLLKEDLGRMGLALVNLRVDGVTQSAKTTPKEEPMNNGADPTIHDEPNSKPSPNEVHQLVAMPLHVLIVRVLCVLGLAAIGGGIFAIYLGSTARSTLNLFGTQIQTDHVGVALVSLGLIVVYLTLRSVLKSQHDLAKLR